MKKILFIIAMLLSFTGMAQTVGQLRYDTVKMYKIGGTTELILQNASSGVVGGVLRNVINGRTVFQTVVDTVFKNATADSFVYYIGGVRRAFKDSSGTGTYARDTIVAGRGLTATTISANKVQLDNDSAVYIVTQINDTTLSFTHYDGRIDTVTIVSSGGGGGSGWGLTGNAGTTPGTNFLGTTDAQGLMFKVNNTQAGYIDIVNFNTSFGSGALINNTTGGINTAFGLDALQTISTGYGNTAVGTTAGSNSIGNENVFIGSNIGTVIGAGNNNTLVGSSAMDGGVVVSAMANTMLGAYTNYSSASVDSAIALGFEAIASTRQLAISPHVTQIKATGITGASNSGYVLTTDGTGIATFQAASGGSGTVTSVAMSVPSWLSVSGSPITTSGTLAVSAATGLTQNQFLATPNGSTGAVSLRSIVAADIPTLNQNTTGSAATLTTARNIWGQSFNGSAAVDGAFTQALSANTVGITSTGYSLTGSNASSLVSLTGTWNTSGNPTALFMNLTNTASGASANLMDLQVGGVSQFKVDKVGTLTLSIGSVSAFNGNFSGFARAGGADYVGWNGRGRFYSSSTTAIEARNSTNADYASVQSLYDRFGSGSPEGVVTAPVGAVYHRTDGTGGEIIYTKQTGSGNTGWTAQPKEYIVTLTQTGTSAPVATISKNTTGTTFTWSYDASGYYHLTADSGTPFTANKTVVTTGNYISNTSQFTSTGYEITSTSVINLFTLDPFLVAGVDDRLVQTAFKIEIYP